MFPSGIQLKKSECMVEHTAELEVGIERGIVKVVMVFYVHERLI